MTAAGIEHVPAETAVLELRALSKSYGSTYALQAMNLELHAGVIHALLGGNGSGKSTTIKILAGVERADEGEIRIGDHVSGAPAWTHRDATSKGLRFVHQDRALFPDMTVAENLALGHGFSKAAGGGISWREQYRVAAAVLERFEIDVSPNAMVSILRPSDQTLVAIARGLSTENTGANRILILDEPTAALPAHEANRLCAALKQQAARGKSILFVSHRIDEVLDLADVITVLRDGQVVASRPRAALGKSELIDLIAGQEFASQQIEARPTSRQGTPRLSLQGLAAGSLSDINLAVAPGEIVGVAGLLGSGRTTLLNVLFGARRPDAGSIELDGRPLRLRSIADAVRRGIALVPEERASDATLTGLTIRENLSAARLRSFSTRRGLDLGREREEAKAAITTYGIKTRDPENTIATLSGGNQQKVILARWLSREPRLLLLDEPTQGVDVGARREIWSLINHAVVNGASVIVVSSDFDELANFAHRAVVLRRGMPLAEVDPDHLSTRGLTELAYGPAEKPSHA